MQGSVISHHPDALILPRSKKKTLSRLWCRAVPLPGNSKEKTLGQIYKGRLVELWDIT